MDRRRFLQATSATIIPASALGKDGHTAPSNRITMGVIGLGGMGTGNLNGFLHKDDTQVLAVCDVDSTHSRDKTGAPPTFGRKPAKARVEKHYSKSKSGSPYKGCDTYADFRKLCARDDIDAVVVATPDHWHALCTLEALRHGKDVYCEKPLTHLFAEGQAIYKQVAKQKAIFQTGSQQRSDIKFQIAVEIVLNGLIGKVKHVEVGLPTGRKGTTGNTTPTTPPESLDYDFWCGPSKKLPHIPARLHRNWRWNLNYGGGSLMDWIGHHNDIAHWGLGIDQTGPVRVEARGFTFPEDTSVYNNAVDYEIHSTFANGTTSIISNHVKGGTKWIGENGWVWVNRGKIEASDSSWIRQSFNRGTVKAYPSRDHRRNFLDGIKTRTECIAPAETAHRSITPGHLGSLSAALAKPLNWDADNETIPDDPAADARLKALPYRTPWQIS